MAKWRAGRVREYGATRGGWRLALPGLLALALLAGLVGAGGVGATPDRPGNPADAGGHRALGTVYAWGYDGLGALGDGTVGGPGCSGVCNATPTQSSPNTLGDVVALAAGDSHTLALKADGTVWAWGADGLGQLGDGTVGGGPIACSNVCNPVPTPIGGLTNVVAVAAGQGHSLALRADGTVWAWGGDGQGQLGDGTVGPNNPTPTQIATLSGVVAIAAGQNHSLALKADGTVWAWGNDSGGQLGDGTVSTPPSNPTPAQISGLSNITAIAAGDFHSLALKADGTVYAWGLDTEGQLGRGSIGTNNPTPTTIPALGGVAAISAGARHSLALKQDGTVWSWGWDDAGQLGDGTANPNNPTPTQIGGLTNVTAIAAGRKHNLALKVGGTVYTWGDDTSGMLGDGTAGGNSPTPAQIAPGTLSGVVAIAAGSDFSLAVAQGSRTLTWGEYGGDTPAIKSGLDNVVAVAGGGAHVLALKADGTVLAWGSDSSGQLGDGTEGSPSSTATPQAVTGLTNVVAVSAGLFHSLALKADGTVWAWGNDDNGRLGNGTTTGNNASPVQVCAVSACTSQLTGVVAIAAGAFHSMALKADGTVWTWGNDASGQLGNGAAGDQDVPTQVLGVGGVGTLGGIVAIAAGGNFSMALGADGLIRTWGSDDDGELGNGAGAPDSCPDSIPCAVAPVALGSPTGVVAIAAGAFHALAVRQDGTAWSWGLDDFGQLGNGGGSGVTTSPAQIPGLTNIVAVDGGFEHSLALKADGTVWALGSNRLGQFGNGPGGAQSCRAVNGSFYPCNQSAAQVAGLTGVAAIGTSDYGSFAIVSPTSATTTAAADATATYGDASATLTATVTSSGTVGAGSVTFTVKGPSPATTAVGSPVAGTVAAGAASATFPLTGVGAGTYSVEASYGGAAGFAASGDPTPATLTIAKATTSLTNVAATPGTIAAGTASVSLSATLGNTSNNAALTGGSVTFAVKQGGTTYCTATDSTVSGSDPVTATATCTFSPAPPVGPMTIEVSYSGDDNFAGSTGSGSLGVDKAATGVTNIAASPTSIPYGTAAVSLGATVSNTSNALALTGGTLTFRVTDAADTVTYCTATAGPVSGGSTYPATGITCTFTTLPAPGGYTIRAAYSGDTSFEASSGSVANGLTIGQAATSTTIGAPTPACGDPTVTVPVTVANASNGAALTGGGSVTVTVRRNGTIIGTGSAPVAGPTPATVNVAVPVAGLTTGTVAIEAGYGGNAAFGASVATPTTAVVTLAGAIVTVPTATATYGDGSATLTATVASANGAALAGGTVTFVVKQGTTVRATLTSGPVASASSVTVSVTLPLDVTWDARNYTIVATYSGDTCFARGDGTGKLALERRILWIKAVDRTVGLGQPNPPTTPPANCLAQATATTVCWLQLANGSGFIYGQSWSALNLTNLRFTYSRNYPSSNASETIGKVYKISATGFSSTNYDLRFVQGTLTVVAP